MTTIESHGSVKTEGAVVVGSGAVSGHGLSASFRCFEKVLPECLTNLLGSQLLSLNQKNFPIHVDYATDPGCAGKPFLKRCEL